MSNEIKCDLCGRIFKRIYNLKRHKESVHFSIKPFRCSQCDFSTKRKDILDRHIKEIHLGIKYTCDRCGESFTQLASLQRHINSIHSQTETFNCEYCDAVFPRKDNLERHINAVHLNLRPHVCEECGASFKLPDHLKQHIISIHTKQRQYTCPECGFSFKLRQHLNEHVKFIHQNLRPHVCEECGKSFSHARTLRHHITGVHTDERPYICEECGRGFAKPDSLRRHKQAEACWFTATTAYKWEELCKEIAAILLADEEWYWKSRIDTPELDEQSYIEPEIIVYYENNTKRIIDAKRSTQAIFKEKDLVVYPKVAEEVEFWCLYGKAAGLFNEADEIEVKDSSEIIEELKEKKNIENESEVDSLIMAIQLLKMGIEYKNQTIL